MTIQQTTPDGSAAARPARRNTSFAGDVLKLVSGTTVAQLLGILASPILTRLYAPEAFGIAAIFTSIVSILGVVACLRYELSIMLPERDEEAVNLLGVSLMFAVLVSLLTVPVIWWGKPFLLDWLNAPALDAYLWLVPLAVLVTGVFLSLNYWNSRTKQFGRLSIAQVSASVAAVATQLGLGFVGFATGGALIGASVGGKALSTGVLGGQIWRDDSKLFLRSIHWQEMRNGIKRHRKFPLYGTWSALLNSISWQLPAFMLSAYFSSAVVGFYALGFRILQMPMNLIGTAIGQVFHQRAAEAKVQGSLAPLVEEVFRRLVMIGLFPMLTLAIIGQDLYVVVFGDDWAEAGVYTQILAVWAFFWFISSPMSRLFGVLERQEFGLAWNLVLFSTRLGSLAFGGYLGDARIALLLFAGTGVLVYGYMNLAIMAVAGVAWSTMWLILGRAFAYFAPFGAGLILLQIAGAQSPTIILAACASFGIYLLLVSRWESKLFQLRL